MELDSLAHTRWCKVGTYAFLGATICLRIYYGTSTTATTQQTQRAFVF